MSPVGLTELLATLPRHDDPNLLVGFDTSDDAAVYRLDDETAIVTTADIITPPVDDGELFGRIAAANALSDIYAMGARPVTALSLVGFPSGALPATTLHAMLAGVSRALAEADCLLAGGHTTEDDEPKLGLAVTGLVKPSEIWRNVGARPGDALVLTKPVGSGVIFNANLKGKVSEAALDACLDALVTLNRAAADAVRPFRPSAVTDVTGFGLAGHALEMAGGRDVTLEIDLDAVPTLDGALEAYERGITTGVNATNRQLVEPHAVLPDDGRSARVEIAFDPQTSGGLLVAVAEEDADALVAALREAGVAAATRIGRVVRRGDARLVLR